LLNEFKIDLDEISKKINVSLKNRINTEDWKLKAKNITYSFISNL
jgi:hypothetical protein